MGGSATRSDTGDGYSFDYELNQNELTGNTTLYRVNTAGGGVSGNVTFNPDLSTKTISPQALIASIPPIAWILIAGSVIVGFYLARRR
jgi:hypothetical protein